MKHTLGVIGLLVATAFWAWIKWSQLKRRSRDSGNSGTQRLFDNDSN
jgi:hypothetical protein